MALTDKQEVFVAEYLKCWNAAEAARRAGYSERHARHIGYQNLTKPHVAEAIEQRKQELLMSAEETLIRLTEQARAEYSEYITDEGTVDLTKLVDAGKAHLIKGIKNTKHGKNIEFYDSQSALSLIGKYHKLFSDRIEHTGADGGAIEYRDVSELSDEQLEAIASTGSDGAAQT